MAASSLGWAPILNPIFLLDRNEALLKSFYFFWKVCFETQSNLLLLLLLWTGNEALLKSVYSFWKILSFDFAASDLLERGHFFVSSTDHVKILTTFSLWLFTGR